MKRAEHLARRIASGGWILCRRLCGHLRSSSPLAVTAVTGSMWSRSWEQWSHCGFDGQMSRKRTIARLPSARAQTLWPNSQNSCIRIECLHLSKLPLPGSLRCHYNLLKVTGFGTCRALTWHILSGSGVWRSLYGAALGNCIVQA